jgi:diguanylate cyclase (GGDEF)-like protein
VKAWLDSMNLPRVAIFIGLYLFFCYLSIVLIHKPGQVTLFWPASGVALVYLVKYGLGWSIPLAIALLIMHSLFNPVSPTFLIFSLLSNMVGACIAAAYIRSLNLASFLSTRTGFALLRASILMAMIGSLIGVTGMLVSGMLPVTDFWSAVAKWGIGDLLGIISVAPALFVLTAGESKNPDSPIHHEYAGSHEKMAWTLTLLSTFTLITFGSDNNSPYALGLAGFPIALVVWSAIRFQPIWTCIGVFLTILLITSLTGLGLAGFKQPADLLDVTLLLSFLCLIALFPMVLLASAHESRISTRKIIRRATTDAETGLPNRIAFEDSARDALDKIGPAQTLAYLDFDHFKLINDTTSHEAGDRLIHGIASMLAATLYPNDRIYRIGGDEFAILFRCEGREAELRAQQVLTSIESFRCSWNEHILNTTASIGLVTLRPGKGDFAQLLSQADTACFTAKELGGNRFCTADYDSPELQEHTETMKWAVRIRQALNLASFELDCQEIQSLADKQSNGRCFEILLRLRDPESGELLPPGLFIPAAERFHLGTKIDRHVIDMVLNWMDAHPAAARSVGACSINLSAKSMEDEGFAEYFRLRLARSQFPAHKIIFEITETSAMQNLSRVQALIGELRVLGCRFALDDFGAGFCSFKYLQNLDVDIFKIDGSFVRDLETSDLSNAVIRSITDIAQVLNKTTIAEHCETEPMRKKLHELGVDYAQGYGIHRPQPIAEYFGTGQRM